MYVFNSLVVGRGVFLKVHSKRLLDPLSSCRKFCCIRDLVVTFWSGHVLDYYKGLLNLSTFVTIWEKREIYANNGSRSFDGINEANQFW